jgi:hypothetical protein
MQYQQKVAQEQHFVLQEWLVLQQQSEQQELHALWLKVIGLLSWLWLLQNANTSLLLLFGSIGSFALIEILLRTQQQRTTQRLLTLEQARHHLQNADPNSSPIIAAQWQLHWQQQRPTGMGLLMDYGRQALKPTVACWYLWLIAATVLRSFI